MLIVAALLIVAATVAVTIRFFAASNAEQAGEAPGLEPGAETTRIRAADTSIGPLKAAGNINLIDKVQVVVRVDGYVKEVLVEGGDTVSAGDLLVSLDRDDLKRAVEQARIRLASAELRLQGLLIGADKAVIELEQLRAQEAELELQKAVDDLAGAQLLATIDGSVLSVDVAEGIKVAPGTIVATLADLSRLELTVQVAEVDIPMVKSGQTVDVAIDAFPEVKFTGVVNHIAPFSETRNGVVNYPVTIRLTDDSLDSVLPGMTAVATLRNEASSDRWLVPTAAIQEESGEMVVIVVRGEEQIPVTVTSEGVQGEWTIVRSAQLQSGDEVLGSTASFVEG
jgi:HlyD family secretion protein